MTKDDAQQVLRTVASLWPEAGDEFNAEIQRGLAEWLMKSVVLKVETVERMIRRYKYEGSVWRAPVMAEMCKPIRIENDAVTRERMNREQNQARLSRKSDSRSRIRDWARKTAANPPKDMDPKMIESVKRIAAGGPLIELPEVKIDDPIVRIQKYERMRKLGTLPAHVKVPADLGGDTCHD